MLRTPLNPVFELKRNYINQDETELLLCYWLLYINMQSEQMTKSNMKLNRVYSVNKMKQPRRSTQSKSEHERHMMSYAKKNSKAYLTEWTKAFTQGSARGCYFLSTNIDESRRTRKREHRCHRSVTPWDLVPCLYRQVQKFSQMNWAVEMDRRSQGPSQSKIGTTSKVVDTHI